MADVLAVMSAAIAVLCAVGGVVLVIRKDERNAQAVLTLAVIMFLISYAYAVVSCVQ